MLGLQSGLFRQPLRHIVVPTSGPLSRLPRLPLRKRSPVLRTKWSRRDLRTRRRAVGLELFIGYVSPAREVFSMSLDTFLGGFAALSLAFGILPLLSPNAKTVKKETDELDDIKWSVATVVSFLPYFNWTVSDSSSVDRLINTLFSLGCWLPLIQRIRLCFTYYHSST